MTTMTSDGNNSRPKDRRQLHQQQHSTLVSLLARRLRGKKYLTDIVTSYVYAVGKVAGEVDVLAHAGDRWRFYEVKVNWNDASYNHALDYYWKFCRAYSNRDVVGIYVTSTHVERLPRYRPPLCSASQSAAEPERE